MFPGLLRAREYIAAAEITAEGVSSQRNERIFNTETSGMHAQGYGG